MLIDVLIILIGLISLMGLAWLIQRKMSDNEAILFWCALLAKVLAGGVLGWIYLEHYGQGDIVVFWQDGQVIANNFFDDPAATLGFFWDDSQHPEFLTQLTTDDSRSLFFVKFAGILAALSGGNYWMMGIIASFISFVAAWYLFECILEFFPDAKRAAAIAFLFWPSTTLWSSGLVKECLAMASMYFLVAILLKVVYRKGIYLWEWITIFLAVWIIWNLKYYWIGIFMPVALGVTLAIFIMQIFPKLVRFEVTVFFAVFSLLLILVTGFHPNFYLYRIFEVIKESHDAFYFLSPDENMIHFTNLGATAVSVMANAPTALVGGLFRPFPWEGHNFLSYCAGVENALLVVALLMALPALRRFFQSHYRVLTAATITYSVLLAVLLALSTPNFGTLSRYKVGFLPFFLFLLLYQNWFLTKKKHLAP